MVSVDCVWRCVCVVRWRGGLRDELTCRALQQARFRNECYTKGLPICVSFALMSVTVSVMCNGLLRYSWFSNWGVGFGIRVEGWGLSVGGGVLRVSVIEERKEVSRRTPTKEQNACFFQWAAARFILPSSFFLFFFSFPSLFFQWAAARLMFLFLSFSLSFQAQASNPKPKTPNSNPEPLVVQSGPLHSQSFWWVETSPSLLLSAGALCALRMPSPPLGTMHAGQRGVCDRSGGAGAGSFLFFCIQQGSSELQRCRVTGSSWDGVYARVCEKIWGSWASLTNLCWQGHTSPPRVRFVLSSGSRRAGHTVGRARAHTHTHTSHTNTAPWGPSPGPPSGVGPDPL